MEATDLLTKKERFDHRNIVAKESMREWQMKGMR